MTNPKIVAKEITTDGASYQIDFGDGMLLWFDVWQDNDGDITGDWNQYIFNTSDAMDMARKSFQDAHNDDVGAYNFATALELCEDAYKNDVNNK